MRASSPSAGRRSQLLIAHGASTEAMAAARRTHNDWTAGAINAPTKKTNHRLSLSVILLRVPHPGTPRARRRGSSTGRATGCPPVRVRPSGSRTPKARRVAGLRVTQLVTACPSRIVVASRDTRECSRSRWWALRTHLSVRNRLCLTVCVMDGDRRKRAGGSFVSPDVVLDGHGLFAAFGRE